MSRSAIPVCFLSAAVTVGCAASSLEPFAFTATYVPVESATGIAVVPACAMIRDLEVSDGRPDGPVIGQRSIQDKPEHYDILLQGDVLVWLRSGLERALDQALFRRDPSAQFELIAKLTVLEISEVAYVNSEYEGRVVIDLELRRPGADRPSWTSRKDGSARNYGSTGIEINYQQTINHALDRAAANIVADEGLANELCGVVAR